MPLPNKALTFNERLGMYVDAVGYKNVGLAWDMAMLPMGDDEHRDLANQLITDDGQD